MTNSEQNNRFCEVCYQPIPDDFQNALCLDCYNKQVVELEQRKKDDEEEKKGNSPFITIPMPLMPPISNQGIQDPNYQTNPEAEDKNQVLANLAQFVYSKKLLWYPTRNMYNAVKLWCMKRATEHPQYPKAIWKPKVVDVGCGSGVGSNVLSQEADFVWGIDKNPFSISFCKEAFNRIKNGIYYSSQLTFDVIDIMTENRELMKFDVVVAIEIIEHLEDTDLFLRQIIKHFASHKKGNYNVAQPTTYFISTPNRNNEKIRKDKPQNLFHVREYTSQEFKALLSNYFQKVSLLNQKGEPVPDDTHETPIMAMASLPKC